MTRHGYCPLQVPFLDINNTLLDTDLPLSVHEYDEWGDPDDPEHFTNIGSYSPYDNVQEGKAYPAMLVKTGLLDSRYSFSHSSTVVFWMSVDFKTICAIIKALISKHSHLNLSFPIVDFS